jgi:predicted RND superfamily exporter protein
VSLLERFFRGVIARRWWIVLAYALLTPPAAWLAVRVGSDNSVSRLVVASDPDALDTRAFQEVFPEGQHVVLLVEASDPFAPEVLARVAALEAALAEIPEVSSFSALTLYTRGRGGFEATPENAEAFREFVQGSALFRQQGLVGPDFLGIPLELKVSGPAERDRVLSAVDLAIDALAREPGTALAVRGIGGPYVDAYLEEETRGASLRYFPLFGAFVITLNLLLYRSGRTLAAFLIVLGENVLLTVSFAWVVGYTFTIVSALVPLTVLITCTATLVYVHSRFVEAPEQFDEDEHLVFALTNKFLPCTASIFAAAVGFAALAVSEIRPIREMGIWTAVGISITWVMVFTLFPALQKILHTPTRHGRRVAGRWFPALAARIPRFSYRWRWVLVPSSLVLCVAGLVALLGVPGRIEPMRLETGALDYLDPDLPLVRQTRRFEGAIGGLSETCLWIRTPDYGVLDPAFLQALERFTTEIERHSGVGSVTGPTTVLRWMRYIGGQGDRLPSDSAAWSTLASDLEQLLLEEPALRGYVDLGSLGQARLRIVSHADGYEAHEELVDFVRERWQAAAAEPGLAGCTMKVVGQGLLQAKIAHFLVPTLAHSFFLTAGIIFVSFFLVFRSGAARLMAMIPSLFAILMMFLLMRVLSIPLNVATILIASTVLGASENDQIHFFYHFQEKRGSGGTTEQSLLHTLLISGRAIGFATLINAGGFLALAFSSLPPMRQFGIISSSAFLLSMLADFTVLPAALWIFFREKPDGP